MMGPGAALAKALIAELSDRERDFLTRWGASNRDFIEGFLCAKFEDPVDYPMVTLSNAARAIAGGEVSL